MIRKQTALVLVFLTIFSIFGAAMAETAAPVETGATAETAAPAPTPYAEPMDGTIRVMLESLGVRDALGLTLEGVYSVDGDRGFQFTPGTEIKLGLDGGNITLQAGGAAIDMGGGFSLTRHLDESGQAGGAFIHESLRNKAYRGDISFGVLPSGGLSVVVTMDIEEYLYGVVPHEMSDEFPLEALKAQAIAARSYAMQRRVMNAGKAYDVVDTTNDQVFYGYDGRYLTAYQAVDETRGVVGMANGSFAEMFYSASNGGQTALATSVWSQGNYDYFDIRDDPYDLENPESTVKKATILKDGSNLNETLSALLIEGAARKLITAGRAKQGDTIGIAEVVGVETINPKVGEGNRQYTTIRFSVKASVTPLAEGGAQGKTEVIDAPIVVDLSFYDQVRTALGIGINASTYDLVAVEETDTGYTLTNRRYGHGVGLSQRGAQTMAGMHGKSYLDIVGFYYPGLQLVQMTWIDKPLVMAAALPESLGYAAARPTPAPTPAPLPSLKEGERYAVVTVDGIDGTLNVREGPSTETRILGVVRNGSRMIVEAETEDGWAKMKTVEFNGYVLMKHIRDEEPGETEAAPKPGSTAAPTLTPSPSALPDAPVAGPLPATPSPLPPDGGETETKEEGKVMYVF